MPKESKLSDLRLYLGTYPTFCRKCVAKNYKTTTNNLNMYMKRNNINHKWVKLCSQCGTINSDNKTQTQTQTQLIYTKSVKYILSELYKAADTLCKYKSNSRLYKLGVSIGNLTLLLELKFDGAINW